MKWEQTRVVVTGSAGVIGRVLVKRLVSLGAEVLAVDIGPHNYNVTGAKFLQADLSRAVPEEVVFFNPQLAFHLAAVFDRTEEKAGYWLTSFDHNVLLSHRLLEQLLRISSLETFVFASSYLVYDPRQYLNVGKPRPLKETDAIAPRNLVGLAKYFTERELDFIQQTEERFRTVSARIFRVYGRGSRDVISRWVRAAVRGEVLEVYGRNNYFDYIYAGDVAEGLLRLAQCRSASGPVNLGSGVARSIGDVVRVLQATFGDLRIKNLDYEGPVEASCADMTLFETLTGWLPQVSLDEGVQRVVAYERGLS